VKPTNGEDKITATPAATEAPALSLNAQELIRRAQDGDAAAFEQLYRSHSRHVYSVCLRMLKNAADAEDITQQVFLSLFRKIGRFRGESRLSTWLHRVTVNAALMHLRRKRAGEAGTESFDTEALPFLTVSDHSMDGAADRINLGRALQKLPAGCRRMFLLHVVLGYEHQEIAKLESCSVGCSKSQVHKARKRLQGLLAQFRQALLSQQGAD
jgi:RNA polymerase sigma-70 factor, ECF subfamily